MMPAVQMAHQQHHHRSSW